MKFRVKENVQIVYTREHPPGEKVWGKELDMLAHSVSCRLKNGFHLVLKTDDVIPVDEEAKAAIGWKTLDEQMDKIKWLMKNTETIPIKEDAVNHPSHYADRKFEVIDIIRDSMSQDSFKGYLYGNLIKYIMRYEKKGGLQDLKKAEVYLKWLMDEVTQLKTEG